MTMVMKQVGPLLMGLQSGTLVGHLAREVISGFDPSIPREGETGIVLVLPNIEKVASDYELDPEAVIKFLAVQDVARYIVVQGVSWVAPYRRNLMTALVDAIEIDTSEMERRLVDLQTLGLEALQEGVAVDASIPLVPTTGHQQALDRVRAFVGLHEGYASRACDAVASELLGDPTKISEVIARQRAATSEAKDLLASVLGFSLDRDLTSTGTTFCAAIEQLEGLQALNQVWAAPDNLPTYGELKDPFVWMDRVLKQD
jgi:putative hydrolase